MAARDWSKVDWTNNEDNNLIREFLADGEDSSAWESAA